MRKQLSFTLFVGFLLVLATAALSAGPSGYHVAKKVTLGGEGGFDALTVDSKARRVYISRSTHVMVVDADTGAVVGDIPNTNGVHGIAIVEDLGKGFTSNGRDSTMTIFDLKTLKEIGRVTVGKNPDAIIYDPASKRVFTMNGASQDTTAIDPKTGTVVGTVALGGRPEFAEADEKGRVFINLEDKSEVVEFDAKKLAVLAHWSLGEGKEPTGIAIDRKHHRLFSSCANKLMVVMNADNGQIVASLPIGTGVDGAGF
ncbi:MAG TPA: YncE family protein, partial [Pyrinomonadaceae bacterium]|nr:YncE family protein [Pyrinomonadaceae bacterium]